MVHSFQSTTGLHEGDEILIKALRVSSTFLQLIGINGLKVLSSRMKGRLIEPPRNPITKIDDIPRAICEREFVGNLCILALSSCWCLCVSQPSPRKKKTILLTKNGCPGETLLSYSFLSQKKAGSVLPFSFVLSTFSEWGKKSC